MNFSATPPAMLATILLFLLTAGLGCATGSGAASREPTEAWNQQTVTALAGQLTTTARRLYTVLYEDPESQAMSMRNAEQSMGGSIRELGESAQGLHAKLKAGKGREKTLGEYKRIKELSRDAAEASGFTDMAIDATSANKAMTDVLGQLDGYYGAW
ncbi:MAG: hypothetical protein VCE43_19570 [Myxococcota bacterium]